MPTFYGNVTGGIASSSFSNPAKIESYSLVNKSGGSITAVVAILYGSTNTYIYSDTILTGESYIYSGKPILLPKDYKVYVLVSGSTDFYFSINPKVD